MKGEVMKSRETRRGLSEDRGQAVMKQQHRWVRTLLRREAHRRWQGGSLQCGQKIEVLSWF